MLRRRSADDRGLRQAPLADDDRDDTAPDRGAFRRRLCAGVGSRAGRVSRLPVNKTYKLFIGGAFPRSESGRNYEAEGANVARGSRKDLRDAVRAARAAFPKWSTMTAYNRGQVVYRIAEMLESRRGEFAELSSGADEVED